MGVIGTVIWVFAIIMFCLILLDNIGDFFK